MTIFGGHRRIQIAYLLHVGFFYYSLLLLTSYSSCLTFLFGTVLPFVFSLFVGMVLGMGMGLNGGKRDYIYWVGEASRELITTLMNV